MSSSHLVEKRRFAYAFAHSADAKREAVTGCFPLHVRNTLCHMNAPSGSYRIVMPVLTSHLYRLTQLREGALLVRTFTLLLFPASRR